MADLVRGFLARKVPHRASYSHVVYCLLRMVHENWNAKHFDSTEAALEYLASEGFSIRQLKVPARGEKLLRQLNREALAEAASPRSIDISSMLETLVTAELEPEPEPEPEPE